MIEILSVVVSFVLATLIGKWLVPALHALKAGQSIKEIGPTWHQSKQGTPTMGGIMFILSIMITCLTVGIPQMKEGNFQHLYVFIFALVFGIIGFIDDFVSIKKHKNTGLTAKQKFALQVLASVGFLFLMKAEGFVTNEVFVPFFNVSFTLPWVFYFIFASFIIVGTVNSVNITDGVDGLSSSVTLPVAIFFGVLGILTGLTQLSIFSFAMLGGLLGFLVYNHHPAKVFMGDTGSLFLGGAVVALAFAYNLPLILIPVGIVYICETLSDIIQVGYFKLTHGKRIFKMAPLHHHFEMCGWSEKKIVLVFTSVSIIFNILAYLAIRNI